MTAQNDNEGCNSCASLAGLVVRFIACFILLVIAPLMQSVVNSVFAEDRTTRFSSSLAPQQLRTTPPVSRQQSSLTPLTL